MSRREPLTHEQVLIAAEQTLRRFGPEKARVVDVARALGVTHAVLYRHFGSKNALREAVTGLWLDQAVDALSGFVTASGPADQRLHDWLFALLEGKRRKAREDPALFATYATTVDRGSELVQRHYADLVGQVAAILRDGLVQGIYLCPDPTATADAVLQATAPFHDPVHAAEWEQPGIKQRFERVWALINNGLATR
ncbi:TetR family transcriptional regulator [Pseudonocardia spinosispora]|uniref:TetR family transcriptional regulator n=1 Tax=Pseudonocardia spinosispora TaxID=103441 RepID=UPI000491BF42|nr:TetR family transcriptional regulator [Pseudonocardia spinosispora]